MIVSGYGQARGNRLTLKPLVLLSSTIIVIFIESDLGVRNVQSRSALSHQQTNNNIVNVTIQNDLLKLKALAKADEEDDRHLWRLVKQRGDRRGYKIENDQSILTAGRVYFPNGTAASTFDSNHKMRGKIVSYKERIEAKRHEWETLIVRLVRPKTCNQLLGLTTGGQPGKYTVFPPTYTFAKTPLQVRTCDLDECTGATGDKERYFVLCLIVTLCVFARLSTCLSASVMVRFASIHRPPWESGFSSKVVLKIKNGVFKMKKMVKS